MKNFFTLIAFFSDMSLFLFSYLVYVLIVTFQKMQEKKSKTTVFFKKKNIPFKIEYWRGDGDKGQSKEIWIDTKYTNVDGNVLKENEDSDLNLIVQK